MGQDSPACGTVSLILPILQMRRESTSLAQVHPTNQWKRKDLNPGLSDSRACLPIFILY